MEIMGHQSAAGYVTTEAFGSVVMFKIVTPEVPPTETITDQDGWIDGERVFAGSKISIHRERAECLVGVGSVYRLTPIKEESVLQYSPLKTTVIEKAERKAIESPGCLDCNSRPCICEESDSADDDNDEDRY